MNFSEFPEALSFTSEKRPKGEKKNWKMFLFGTLSESDLAYHFSHGR
jgi:hypothetical protein